MFGNFIDVIISVLAVLGLLMILLAYRNERRRLDSEYQMQEDWLEERKNASKRRQIPRKGQQMAKILIVDDAAFMRMMLRDILTKNGFEVIGEAVNGADGVAKYKELSPDVVTMDITMPEMDGLAALKEIKKVDPSARVLMCSAMGQQAMVIEAIQNGAKDFIVKPFQAERVKEAVNKALR